MSSRCSAPFPSTTRPWTPASTAWANSNPQGDIQMIDALYISATGLRSQQEQIDVISNNVANMQTPGFKKSRVNFAEMSGLQSAPEAQALPQFNGDGTRIVSTLQVFSE